MPPRPISDLRRLTNYARSSQIPADTRMPSGATSFDVDEYITVAHLDLVRPQRVRRGRVDVLAGANRESTAVTGTFDFVARHDVGVLAEDTVGMWANV